MVFYLGIYGLHNNEEYNYKNIFNSMGFLRAIQFLSWEWVLLGMNQKCASSVDPLLCGLYDCVKRFGQQVSKKVIP